MILRLGFRLNMDPTNPQQERGRQFGELVPPSLSLSLSVSVSAEEREALNRQLCLKPQARSPKELVGIIGRVGAGKSALVADFQRTGGRISDIDFLHTPIGSRV